MKSVEVVSPIDLMSVLVFSSHFLPSPRDDSRCGRDKQTAERRDPFKPSEKRGCNCSAKREQMISRVCRNGVLVQVCEHFCFLSLSFRTWRGIDGRRGRGCRDDGECNRGFRALPWGLPSYGRGILWMLTPSGLRKRMSEKERHSEAPNNPALKGTLHAQYTYCSTTRKCLLLPVLLRLHSLSLL